MQDEDLSGQQFGGATPFFPLQGSLVRTVISASGPGQGLRPSCSAPHPPHTLPNPSLSHKEACWLQTRASQHRCGPVSWCGGQWQNILGHPLHPHLKLSLTFGPRPQSVSLSMNPRMKCLMSQQHTEYMHTHMSTRTQRTPTCTYTC